MTIVEMNLPGSLGFRTGSTSVHTSRTLMLEELSLHLDFTSAFADWLCSPPYSDYAESYFAAPARLGAAPLAAFKKVVAGHVTDALIRPFVTAGVLRKNPNVKWTKDRGNEPQRDKAEFPWFWNGDTPNAERVNDVHLTTAEKQAARYKLKAKGARP